MNKLEDIIDLTKITEFLQKKDLIKVKEEKKRNCVIVIAVIAGIAIMAAIAFGIYKYLTAEDYDDFEDDFDDFEDDFDDDFDEFEEEDGRNKDEE